MIEVHNLFLLQFFNLLKLFGNTKDLYIYNFTHSSKSHTKIESLLWPIKSLLFM